MKTDSTELFPSIPASPLPELEAARRRWRIAHERAEEAAQLLENQGPEAAPVWDAAQSELRMAATDVIRLEREAMGRA